MYLFKKKCANKTCDLNLPLIYCINDEIYLCEKCDADFHSLEKSKVFRNHVRLKNGFSIIYKDKCLEHKQDYTYFCFQCMAVNCSSCLTDNLDHILDKQHEQKELKEVEEDILKEKLIVLA